VETLGKPSLRPPPNERQDSPQRPLSPSVKRDLCNIVSLEFDDRVRRPNRPTSPPPLKEQIVASHTLLYNTKLVPRTFCLGRRAPRLVDHHPNWDLWSTPFQTKEVHHFETKLVG